ncbi:MAG: alpha-mannosidase, partial [Eubacteriales bacterium]
MIKNKIFLIGNAHLDPVWLWRKTEGFAEIKSTFRSALDRMNEFPDYIFTASSASYYKWIEESEPEMFEEIKQRVAEGRWVLAGGLWVQPDCNIPSGEAFARHMLYSQRYYMSKFGKICEFGYNVDSFGHNGMLPQLLKHGGMNAYVMMRPDKHENPSLPTALFNWESPDGSNALTFRIPDGYGAGSWSSHESQVLRFRNIAEQEDIPLMSFYGVGNHGGGPTMRHICALEKAVNESGGEICFAGPWDYFEHVRKAVEALAIPTVKGDLQHHASGCYAANSTVKQKNRKTENLLVTAEKYDWLSNKLTGSKLNTAKFAIAWEKVLFNQFHDILAGCSIRSAYEDAYNSFGYACDTAWEAANFAMQKISWRVNTKALFKMPGKEDGAALFADNGEGEPSVVFNPHSFPVKAPAYIPYVSQEVCDDQGRPIPFQIVRAERTNGTDKFETMIMAEVPAFGWATHYAYRRNELNNPKIAAVSAEEDTLENDLVRIEFDMYTGWIKSYFDKTTKKELVKAPFAKPILIRDDQTDTWSHRVFEFRDEI